MPNAKKRISVNSTMQKVSELNGHVYDVPVPCVVHGVYFELTGTVILECVWCDGENYLVPELHPEELKKFNDELQEAVLWAEF
jgi:hypothetical protein